MLRSLCAFNRYRALVPLLLVARVALFAIVIAAALLYLSRDDSGSRRAR